MFELCEWTISTSMCGYQGGIEKQPPTHATHVAAFIAGVGMVALAKKSMWLYEILFFVIQIGKVQSSFVLITV